MNKEDTVVPYALDHYDSSYFQALNTQEVSEGVLRAEQEGSRLRGPVLQQHSGKEGDIIGSPPAVLQPGSGCPIPLGFLCWHQEGVGRSGVSDIRSALFSDPLLSDPNSVHPCFSGFIISALSWREQVLRSFTNLVLARLRQSRYRPNRRLSENHDYVRLPQATVHHTLPSAS